MEDTTLFNLHHDCLINILSHLMRQEYCLEDCIALICVCKISNEIIPNVLRDARLRLLSDENVYLFDLPKRKTIENCREDGHMYHIDSVNRFGMVRFRHISFHKFEKNVECVQKDEKSYYRSQCPCFSDLTLDDNFLIYKIFLKKKPDLASVNVFIGALMAEKSMYSLEENVVDFSKLCDQKKILSMDAGCIDHMLKERNNSVLLPEGIYTARIPNNIEIHCKNQSDRSQVVRLDTYCYTSTIFDEKMEEKLAFYTNDGIVGNVFRYSEQLSDKEMIKVLKILWDETASNQFERIKKLFNR